MDDRSLDVTRPDAAAGERSLSRRQFVGGAGAVIGAAATIPALVSLVVDDHPALPPDGATGSAPGGAPDGIIDLTTPVVVHISDPARGEVTIFVGDEAHTFTDPELVARVMRSRS